MTPRVSVVVPTYRRPMLIARCLEALRAQDLDPEAYEVVVVDDEPSGETRAAVEAQASLAARPAIRYLERGEARGPAAARNLGARVARAPVIAFTDDDCIPGPGWLSAGLAAIEDGADAVPGRVVVPHGVPPTDFERMTGGLATAAFVTANCFCTRAAFEAVGGFDERFTTAWREDSDLHFALIEAGFRVQRSDLAVVVHPVRPARWGISVLEQRKSQFNALLFRKHPALYLREIGGCGNPRYLGIALALAGFGVGVVRGSRSLAAVSAAAWAAQTLAFTATRLRATARTPAHVLEMAATSAVIPLLSIYWRLRGAVRYRVLFL